MEAIAASLLWDVAGEEVLYEVTRKLLSLSGSCSNEAETLLVYKCVYVCVVCVCVCVCVCVRVCMYVYIYI